MKHGTEQKVRFQLHHSFNTYGIQQDGEVEGLALKSAPWKPLIRAVYILTTRHRFNALL